MLQLQPARHFESVSRPVWCAGSPRAIHFPIWPVIVALQAPIFRIWDAATDKFTTVDVLQIQSAGHLESLAGPAWWAETPRTIHSVISLLVVAMHAQISRIFGIWDLAAYGLTTLHPLPLQWARHCGSHPRPIQCAEPSHAVLPVVQLLPVALQVQTLPIFGIWDHDLPVFSTLRPLSLQSVRDLEPCTTPIRSVESPRAIRFPISLLVVILRAQTSPIFGI